MELEHYIVLAMSGLAAVAWFMIRVISRGWDDRILLNSEKIDETRGKVWEHDSELATIKANMEHIRKTGDETREDVKAILRNSNGKAAK